MAGASTHRSLQHRQSGANSQCHDFLLGLPSSDVLSLYDWAEQDDNAVAKCTCRHVRRMAPMKSLSSSLGGLSFFRHLNFPCVRAEVCGMIVGVICKEDNITYDVDDGTAVLRIMQKRSKRRRWRPTSDVVDATGIPDCYIYSRWYKHDEDSAPFARSPMLATMVPAFELGDTVLCRGKIVVDRVSGCYMHIHKATKCEDLNAECLHQLDVISRAESIYSAPLTEAAIAARRAANPRPRRLRSPSTSDESGEDGDGSMSRKSMRTKRDTDLRMSAAEARRTILGENAFTAVRDSPEPERPNGERSDRDRREGVTSGQHLLDRRDRPVREYPMTPAQQHARNIILGITRLPPPLHAQPPAAMRAPPSAARFEPPSAQAHVQSDWEILVTPPQEDYRAASGSRPDQSSSMTRNYEDRPSSRSMRTQDKIPDSKLTEGYFRHRMQELIKRHTDEDPVFLLRSDRRFGLRDLMSHEDLRLTADRIVANSATLYPRGITSLFESSVRHLMHDGFILLAPQGSSTPRGHEDFYMMATPELLRRLILQIADPTARRWRNSDPSRVIDDILARIRMIDDRFRYLNRVAVQEAWDLAQRMAV